MDTGTSKIMKENNQINIHHFSERGGKKGGDSILKRLRTCNTQIQCRVLDWILGQLRKCEYDLDVR